MNLGVTFPQKRYPPPKEGPIGILIDITLNLYVILRKKKRFLFTIQFSHLGTLMNLYSVRAPSAVSCSFLCMGRADQRMVGTEETLKRL